MPTSSQRTLIASISGIRGIFGRGLSPEVLVTYSSAFGAWCCQRRGAGADAPPIVVVGRDGRVTGGLCARIVIGALQSTGCHVIDAGMTTTPTLAMAVTAAEASGGIMISASHNPAEWNALKLLNDQGEFLDQQEGHQVMELADASEEYVVQYDRTGTYRQHDFLFHHIDAVLSLDYINSEDVDTRNFRVVVDGINSSGAVALPALLRALGLKDEQIVLVNGTPNGRFAHPPEPLPGNLIETMEQVQNAGADLGLVVDPDADRLALIDERGQYVSEELTQVLAADFLWRRRPGSFVTNLSSSRAIEDVARRYGATVYRSAVGEINVVKKMQEVGAILGGEGNGGVIVPELHYGRDALAATAIILQHLADLDSPLSEVVQSLPAYALSKKKLPLDNLEVDYLLNGVAARYQGARLSTIDGVKIDLDEGWVHMRPSNTEPILRVYAEAATQEEADTLAQRFVNELVAVSKG